MIVGCKKESNISNPSAEGEKSNLTFIKDTIENWTLGKRKILKLGLIANTTNAITEYVSTTIDSNGIFFISLDQVKPSNLTSIVQIENLPVSFINISDPNVKGALGEMLIYNPDTVKPSWMAACISKINRDSIGSYTLDFLYVESNMDITGTFVGYSLVDGKNDTVTYNYDLHYKAGWNKIVCTLTSRTEYGLNVNESYHFSNSENSDSEWFVWFIRL